MSLNENKDHDFRPVLSSLQEAADMMKQAHQDGGNEALGALLAPYCADVIFAEEGKQLRNAKRNVQIITKAMILLPQEYRAQVTMAWTAMNQDAIKIAQTVQKIDDLFEALNPESGLRGLIESMGNPLEDFQSFIEDLKSLSGVDVSDYEAFPLSLFCEGFQAWAVATEESLRDALQGEADVNVYKVKDANPDDILCLVVCAPKMPSPEAQESLKYQSFRVVVPYSCLADERHFMDKHFPELMARFTIFLNAMIEKR